jgi:hypothetical protein
MRFARSDMRGYVVSHKNDYGASHWLYGVLQWRSRLKINFCEILGAGRFSTFATKSTLSGPIQRVGGSAHSFDNYLCLTSCFAARVAASM